MHVAADIAPGEITTMIRDLAGLGLPIHVSELDVSLTRSENKLLSRGELQRRQTAVYAEAAEAFMALPERQRFAFTVWGLRDRDSWLTAENAADAPADLRQRRPAQGRRDGLAGAFRAEAAAASSAPLSLVSRLRVLARARICRRWDMGSCGTSEANSTPSSVAMKRRTAIVRLSPSPGTSQARHPLEEPGDRGLQRHRHAVELGGADAVGPALVLLQLLERDAHAVGQLGLARGPWPCAACGTGEATWISTG